MDILDICLQDRRNSLAHQKNGWYKDNGIDLVVKMYILLLNSIGFCKPGETVRSKYIFVDEINNSNMRNNLYATRRKFSDAGEQTAFLRFYSVDGEDHLKLNLFQVLLLGISLSLAVIPHIISSSIFRKNRLEQVLKVLLRIYKKYLNYIGKEKYFVLMSDHHYYSSIVAMTNTEKSMVIQHGLVMDKRFYYPIRAGHFCAWGNHSKILLDNDEKVVVLGTYKFDGITRVPSEKNFKKILFCVGSLDTERVIEKIDILHKISQKCDMELFVKCHPGSLFDHKTIMQRFANDNIVFYKEEKLTDLDFDLAISENSTVIMDLIAMQKPFILFDTIEGYFERYSGLIPRGNSYEEMMSCLQDCGAIDYQEIALKLREQEINNGECSIYEFAKELAK